MAKIAIVVEGSNEQKLRKLGVKVINVSGKRVSDKVRDALSKLNPSVDACVFIPRAHWSVKRVVETAAEFAVPTIVKGYGPLPTPDAPGKWTGVSGWGAKFTPQHQYIPEAKQRQGELDHDGFFLPDQDDHMDHGRWEELHPEHATKWAEDVDGYELRMQDREKYLRDNHLLPGTKLLTKEEFEQEQEDLRRYYRTPGNPNPWRSGNPWQREYWWVYSRMGDDDEFQVVDPSYWELELTPAA